MSRIPNSPYWSANPSIPIYLDSGEGQESSKPGETPDHICPNCATSSRDQPIHCISVTSPAPPSYSSIAPPPQSSTLLAVPTLNVVTPQGWARPQPPRPALQFDTQGRPNLRFRQNAFSPISPPGQDEDIDWSRKSQVGLGIPEAPFQPDASPITPGTAEKNVEEKSKGLWSASNVAQRIEERLWKYRESRNVIKRWLLEIISWSLSAACMAGIIIMLMVYKNERIPKWPLGLTLNAYISVLSKIASAALLLPVSEALGQLKWSWFQGDRSKKMWDFELFDNASRGPWGSFLLVIRTKGKSLAALGAAVTVFALALDPFFQQVVQYPEEWRVQAGNGSIPRAVSYVPALSGQLYRAGSEQIEIDPNMAAIAYHYFYDNGTMPITFGKGIRSEVPLACPSSNCTWPDYDTLGVCSKCVKASDQLEFKCLNAPLDWAQVPGVDDKFYVQYVNGTACGWFLKADAPLLMTGYNVDRDTPDAGELLLMRAQPLYDLFTREFLPGYKPKLNNSRNPLAHVIIAAGGHLDDIHRNATPIAHECVISWCVQTISSVYTEGGYTENVTHSIINDTVGASPWVTETDIIDEASGINSTSYFYFENIVVKGRDGSLFHVDNNTHVLTLSLFDDIFPSQYTLINSTDETHAMLRYKQYITLGPYTRNITHNPWLFNNISANLDKLSTGITNMIRSATGNVTEMIQGPAFDKESFVDVRWPWLVLPIGLLAGTFIFLVSTVIRSSLEKDHVGVWKTSAIATLLYGLPDDMQKQITGSKEHGTPRANAKEVRVKWIRGSKGGWRFSEPACAGGPPYDTFRNTPSAQ
ncbi:hypothetical protein EJ04DRAFT_564103 [Polyplosphaeria fusca]|uniref:DUF3176 domain containing protein n=1 Tax=Polyplosphaeria fusca TaxID=682080 RepID=A0A9P4QVJ0_9PLEO|nr:hypothetical protein EJ04DRAFT_564103 [Polyplosphaeria fusca]